MSDQGKQEAGGQTIESSSPEIAKKSKWAEALKKFQAIMERVFSRKGKAREVLTEWGKGGSQTPPTGSLENGVPSAPVPSETPPSTAGDNPDAKQAPPPVESNPVQASASSESASQPDEARPVAPTEVPPRVGVATPPETASQPDGTPTTTTPAETTPTTAQTTPTEGDKTPPANPTEANFPPETPPQAGTDKKPEEDSKKQQQEELKRSLEARREQVRGALREIAKVLLKHKDPLVFLVIQAIGANDSPVGDQLREAILARAKQVCDMSYSKDKLNLPENIVAASPLLTRGVAIEDTPLADLLVTKLGIKRGDLKLKSDSEDTMLDQTEGLYKQFARSRFVSTLGQELFGDEWRAKMNLQNQNVFQLVRRFFSGEGFRAFNLKTPNILADMLHTGEVGVDGTNREAGSLRRMILKSQIENLAGNVWARRKGIMESPYVHIGFLVFMTVLQAAQQSGREGSQASEH